VCRIIPASFGLSSFTVPVRLNNYMQWISILETHKYGITLAMGRLLVSRPDPILLRRAHRQMCLS
jgi:hypothetical protein